MCGRFTLKSPERVKFENVVNSVDLDVDDLIPRYNIAPSQNVLAVLERESIREV